MVKQRNETNTNSGSQILKVSFITYIIYVLLSWKLNTEFIAGKNHALSTTFAFFHEWVATLVTEMGNDCQQELSLCNDCITYLFVFFIILSACELCL